MYASFLTCAIATGGRGDRGGRGGRCERGGRRGDRGVCSGVRGGRGGGDRTDERGGRGRAGDRQPPARRRRLVIRDSSSSSEEEFRLPSSPVRVRAVRVGVRNGVRQHADYVGGRVRVPGSYFNLENNQFYGGRVGEWGRYRSFGGGYSYGYYIHYDDGIKYYMLESDVHSYIVQE